MTLVSAEIQAEESEAPLYPSQTSRFWELEPAALAVARATCAQVKGEQCDTLREINPEDDPEPMEVVWGLHPAAFNCKHEWRTEDPRVKNLCPDIFWRWYTRPFQLLWEAVFFPRHYRVTDPMPIPYHATISAEQVLDPDKRDKLKSVLTGKIVIYGARIAMVKDRTYSPVHGSIHAVFIHAVAIDNLLTFGNRYIYRAAGQLTFRKELIEFLPTALIILTVFAIMVYRRRLLRTVPFGDQGILRERDEHCLRWVRRILYPTIFGLGVYVFCILRISPINWLALFISAGVADWIERRFSPFAPQPQQDG